MFCVWNAKINFYEIKPEEKIVSFAYYTKWVWFSYRLFLCQTVCAMCFCGAQHRWPPWINIYYSYDSFLLWMDEFGNINIWNVHNIMKLTASINLKWLITFLSGIEFLIIMRKILSYSIVRTICMQLILCEWI